MGVKKKQKSRKRAAPEVTQSRQTRLPARKPQQPLVGNRGQHVGRLLVLMGRQSSNFGHWSILRSCVSNYTSVLGRQQHACCREPVPAVPLGDATNQPDLYRQQAVPSSDQSSGNGWSSCQAALSLNQLQDRMQMQLLHHSLFQPDPPIT